MVHDLIISRKTRWPLTEVFLLFVVAVLCGVGLTLASKYVFLLSAVSIMAVIFLLNPMIGLLMLLGSRTYLDRFIDVPFLYLGNARVNLQGILGVAVVLWAITYIFKTNMSFSKMKFAFPGFLMVGTGILALYSSSMKSEGIGDLFRISSWIFLAIVIADVFNTEKKINLLINVVLFALIPLLASTLWAIMTHSVGTYYQDVTGYFSWFANPQSSSTVMTILLPFAILRFLNVPSLKKMFYGIIISLILICIFVSYVRTAQLGAILVLLVFLFLTRTSKYRKVIITVALVLCFLVVTRSGVISLSRWQQEATAIKTRDFSNTDLGSQRLNSNILLLRIFSHSSFIEMLVGHGMKYTLALWYSPVMPSNYWQPMNDFTTVLLEMGLVGLLSYLWFIYNLFQPARRLLRAREPTVRNRGIAYIAVLVAFIQMSFTYGGMTSLILAWYVAAFIGMAFSSVRIIEERKGVV